MSEKNAITTILSAVVVFLTGFVVCWLTKPTPDPVIEVNARGIFVNGKHVDLDKFKIAIPALPAAPDKSKRKPGDLPSGGLPGKPAAANDFPAESVVRNRAGSDGAGLSVPASLETASRKLGISALSGFTDYCSKQPGGHWPDKVNRQLAEFTKDKVKVSWADYTNGEWKPIVTGLLDNGNVPVLLLNARLQGYDGNQVAHSIIIVKYRFVPPAGDYALTYVDCNFPDKQFVTWAGDLPNEMTVGILPLPKKTDAMSALCPCGELCACKPCHCHAAKLVTFTLDEEDDPPIVVGQRGSNGGTQILGIDTLVSVLQKFHDSFFGTGNRPGLKDDISGGLKEFWGSVRAGFLVAGGTLGALLLWMAVSLHRIADKKAA